MKKVLFAGFSIVVCSMTAIASVGARAPEIDASSVPAVIALVSGGILMLRSKFRSK